MDNHINMSQVVRRLAENGIPHAVCRLHDDVHIVVCERGGRVFGPFFPGEADSILWLNAAFAEPEAFRELLSSGDWNLGGDRVWIGPEIEYSIVDRGLTGAPIKEVVQPQIDPGHYVLSPAEPSGAWRLRTEVVADAFNLSPGSKTFVLERVILETCNPLASLHDFRDLMQGVRFAGYEQRLTLSDRTNASTLSNVWSLIQLNPGGRIITPTSSEAQVVDYYQPVDAQVHTVFRDHAVAEITGDRQYKIGYSAASLWGRMAYFCPLEDHLHYLLIRHFFNNPSGTYLDEPAGQPGANGASAFIYNDDGGIGGFGELEYQGQAVGSPVGRLSCTDISVLWLYVADNAALNRIANRLLGVDVT